MADSLILRGYRDIRNQTGSEMVLMTDEGRYDHSIKEYEDVSENVQTYITGTKLKVTQGGDEVVLALDSNPDTTIRIDLADDFEFTFYNPRSIRSAALMEMDGTVIERYVFPTSPGVGVKVVDGPGDRPEAADP